MRQLILQLLTTGINKKYKRYTNMFDGTTATQADVTVYKAFQKEFPQFTRWFNHIASFTEEFEDLPAGKAPAASGSAAALLKKKMTKMSTCSVLMMKLMKKLKN